MAEDRIVQVVWFKRDLRIHDHQPLQQAAAQGPVLAVFAIEPEQWQTPDSALRHWQFAADSLVDLAEALAGLNLPLCCWQGSVLALLDALKACYGDFALHSHQETGNAWSHARDDAVAAWCQTHAVSWHQARQHGVIRGLTQRQQWETQWETLMAAATCPAPANAEPANGWEAFHHVSISSLTSLTLGDDQTPCPQR